jgi:hypothetical protein
VRVAVPRRQEALAAQHRSNQQQLARKAAAAQADRAADAAFKEAWTQRLAQLKQEELQEAADARDKALQVGPKLSCAAATFDSLKHHVAGIIWNA